MTNQEILEQDPKFFDRADAHIHLSNSQIEGVNHGKVSASMMYATARFNAYVSWNGFNDKAAFAEARDEAIDVSTTCGSGWLYSADKPLMIARDVERKRTPDCLLDHIPNVWHLATRRFAGINESAP